MKKLNNLLRVFTVLTVAAFLGACSSNNKGTTPQDTPTTGVAEIAVDECFQPIIESEINVFENIYREANIIPRFLPENKAIEMLLKDSVKLAIATRPLTKKEMAFMEGKKLFPKVVKIAVDGVALIVNPANKDTLISVAVIRQIMEGKITRWNQINPKSKLGDIQVVFDNQNSSTVRYVVDSICKGAKLSEKLTAKNYNQDVVNFISKNKNALGVIGVNWVSDRDDTTTMSFLKQIKVMGVSYDSIADYDNCYQPYQAYLATGQYPLRRDVYIINAEPRTGLVSGFTSFAASQRGQRIILKSGLLPATQSLRIIRVKDEF